MVDHVALPGLHYLLEGHAQRRGGEFDLGEAATKADQPLVEGLGEATQVRALIAFRIDGHEQGLQVRRGRTDLLKGIGKHAQAGRAQVRAMHVSEIDEEPLLWKIAAAYDAAVGVDET